MRIHNISAQNDPFPQLRMKKKKTVNEPNIKVRYYSITEILTIKEY